MIGIRRQAVLSIQSGSSSPHEDCLLQDALQVGSRGKNLFPIR